MTDIAKNENVSIEEQADGKTTIIGYAAVFDSPSVELEAPDGRKYTEHIKPDAFTEALNSGEEIQADIEHTDSILATTKDGSLKVEQDDIGLKIEMVVDSDNAIVDQLKKDGSGMSFRFHARSYESDRWKYQGDKLHRYLEKVDKLDRITLTNYPAYTATKAVITEKSKQEISRENNSEKKEGFLPDKYKYRYRWLMLDK